MHELPITTSCFPAATLYVWHDVPTFKGAKMQLVKALDIELPGRNEVALAVESGPCRHELRTSTSSFPAAMALDKPPAMLDPLVGPR
jgi:hypothetical protein